MRDAAELGKLNSGYLQGEARTESNAVGSSNQLRIRRTLNLPRTCEKTNVRLSVILRDSGKWLISAISEFSIDQADTPICSGGDGIIMSNHEDREVLFFPQFLQD